MFSKPATKLVAIGVGVLLSGLAGCTPERDRVGAITGPSDRARHAWSQAYSSNCYRGGDDFDSSATWTPATGCSGYYGFTNQSVVVSLAGDTLFDISLDTAGKQPIYAVAAYYYYGNRYQYAAASTDGVLAGYKLLGTQRISPSHQRLDTMTVTVDLPYNADAVMLVGYVGYCRLTTLAISDSACAVSGMTLVNQGTDFMHDEPRFCFNNSGVGSQIFTCSSLVQDGVTYVPNYVNYPPFANLGSGVVKGADTYTCFATCPTMQWMNEYSFDASNSFDPDGTITNYDYFDKNTSQHHNSAYSTHSIWDAVYRTGSGPWYNFRLYVSDGFSKHYYN